MAVHPAGPLADPPTPAWLKDQGRRADGLIELLNHCQELHGSLTASHLLAIARHLQLPRSRVWGTASFYHLFRLTAPPQHSCLICTGTACHLKGAAPIWSAIQQALAQPPWQAAGIELGAVRCIGTCGGAPLAVIDGIVCDRQTSTTLLAQLAALVP